MRGILVVPILLITLTAEAFTQHQRWRLVPELRIGSIDGPQALGRVHDLLVSLDGRHLYVGQPQSYDFRVYDATTGRLVRTFGGRGGGPGEFNYLGRPGWKQDTLYVTDRVLQRVVMFSADGEHLRTLRIVSEPLEPTGLPAVPVALCPDGSVLGSPNLSLGGISAGAITARPFVQLTRSGQVLSTLAALDVRHTASRLVGESFVSIFVQPLSQWTHWASSRDGASHVLVNAPPATSGVASYQVTRIACNGDTLYHRSLRYEPRRVSREIADSIYDFYAQHAFQRAGEPARARQIARRYVTVPPFWPPISEVVVASDGAVWLNRGAGDATEWLVLNVQGHVHASVVAPRGFRILEVHHGQVWGVEHDELDIPYVVRYRIEGVRARP